MAAITLTRAEFLVILDILHAEHVFGLDGDSLIPQDRETHLELIHQGIRQLESRGLVEIKRGRHIIERRLLEMVSIVARPQLVIKTLRDRAGIGVQLYLHYQTGDEVIEQMLPADGLFSLGQLPNMTSALDRIVRMLDLPTESCAFDIGQAIELNQLHDAQSRLESGDLAGAMAGLVSIGWPAAFSDSYLAALGSRKLAGQVSLAAIDEAQVGESLSLTLVNGEASAWLLIPQPGEMNRLVVRQVNAAAFRQELDFAYSTIYQQTQELP